MAQVPSNWALLNSPSLVTASAIFRPVADSLTTFFAATNLNASIATGTVQTITPTTIFHDDPVGRVVTFNYVTVNAGSARTLTIRVTGINQFGETVTEDIVISQAINLTRVYFTRFAYIALVSVALVAGTNTSSGGSDTLSAGIVALTGTAGTAGTQANGASATHFQGFGLPIQVKNTLSAAAPTTIDQVEVRGYSISETAAAASTRAALNRGAGFLVDAQFSVMVPQETFVLTGDGLREVRITVQTNRGE